MTRISAFILGLTTLVGFSLLSTPLQAQKKNFTFQEAYEGGARNLTGSLPSIQGWLDDDHYLERKRKEGSRTKTYQVHAKSGKETEYERPRPKRINLRKLSDGGQNPRLSPDSSRVAFTKGGNLYVNSVEEGQAVALTNDGGDLIYNGYASWVYYEEILGRRSRYAAFWWSPDSRKIAYLRFDDQEVPEFPIFRSTGTHGELEVMRYPKAGDPSPGVKLGIVDVETKETTWVELDENLEYTAWPFWTSDSKELFFQQLNRDQNYLRILAANPETGKTRTVYEEKQPSWVDWFEDLHFLSDGKGFLLRSSIDGYFHLYHYDMQGKLVNRLTEGEWTVNSMTLVDEENERVFFHASGMKDKVGETHFFKVDMAGKKVVQLTEAPGTHRCVPSDGGSYFTDRYSSISHPSKLELRSDKGKLIRELGDSRSEAMDAYAMGKVELFTIPSTDGYNLPAVWVLPPDFDPNKKYPIVFSIYSGPGAGTVRNSQRSLQDHFLAQHGIITISVDHRGSGHFGKKGIAEMHRNLGKWESHDLIEAVKWLRKKSFIDPERVGITGGSYGGYMTCLALTKGADYFTHGIARSSVTDWQLYDNVYTERYMDHPQDNPGGYKDGSVLTYAKDFKGKLLIIHGTMDDNVHMQNTIQLVDKFTSMGKDFEFMLYPGQRHGIGYPMRSHLVEMSLKFWFEHFFDEEAPIE
ncbi:MAG: DPP IV N-terminal domain-containing protein [Bacteroidota bacterium]